MGRNGMQWVKRGWCQMLCFCGSRVRRVRLGYFPPHMARLHGDLSRKVAKLVDILVFLLCMGIKLIIRSTAVVHGKS